MKIIVTGSLGNIGKPLTRELLQNGHDVTVISSTANKQAEIGSMGAKAAIGSIEEANFVAGVFRNADAAFCMTPPNFGAADQIDYYEKIAHSYANAIVNSGIKRIIYLSSYGAHLNSGTGFITGSNLGERILDAVPDILLTHVRPTYFYYNLAAFIPMIKNAGFIGSVYGGEDALATVDPKDIARVIARELTDFKNVKKVCYVSSDERTCNEVARILGSAIGKPDLQWRILPREQVMQSLLAHGVSNNTAQNIIELGEATHSGILRQDYELNKPALGQVKIEDFAKEFAAAYNER